MDIDITPKPKYWPKYNPWMLEVAMNARGLMFKDLANATDIPVKTISQMVKGEIEITEEPLRKLAFWLDYPMAFFEQYWKYKMEWEGGCMPRNVKINYWEYPIMRGE